MEDAKEAIMDPRRWFLNYIGPPLHGHAWPPSVNYLKGPSVGPFDSFFNVNFFLDFILK